jgi:superfamily II DNA or RNA helicase
LIQQLLSPGFEILVGIEPLEDSRVKGFVLKPRISGASEILVITNAAKVPERFDRVLRVRLKTPTASSTLSSEYKSVKWIKHPKLSQVPASPIDYQSRIHKTLESWQGKFQYIQEVREKNIRGLRLPQIGAIHAVHSHWAVSNRPATIVMPTGTGKTETMLSVLVSTPCQRLLVIVPTDALRSQLFDKFLTLGKLKEIGAISNDASYPIVGLLRHKPRNLTEIDDFFSKCNVVITTMSIVGQCSNKMKEQIASHCKVLFIDEAHHIAAETWSECKEKFASRKIIQFTATPYRNDDKLVGGDIIFNYPLTKAQEEGYFTAINFKSVIEYDPSKSDLIIAEAAIQQLIEDRKHFDHILMARVKSVDRAKQVFKLYEKYSEFNPVQLHTGIKSVKERELIRNKIIEGKSSIVVCVDMLGEGFDLPRLKIAAFHDVKKSLPITLQLVGRFTRFMPDLGEATVIANTAQLDVEEELKKLYSQNPDWNDILRRTSQGLVQKQIDLQKFISNFGTDCKQIPLQNLRPAMSAVIYHTKCEDWKPEDYCSGIPGIGSLEHIHHEINKYDDTLVIVTAKKVPIDWINVGDIFSWEWELYILYWNREQKLLFIHSSTNNGYFKKLAEAVAGEVELVNGPRVFHCFSGINRLRLQNVGLIEQLGRLIRYTMRAGSDVESGLTEAQTRNVIKSNIFGIGYEDGSKVSIGCSYKGRIWSRNITNIEALTKWCSHIGSKILDNTVNAESVLKGTLVPKSISQRPNIMPIAIEWPLIMYKEPETTYDLIFDSETIQPLYNFDIRLTNPTESGELKFEVCSDSKRLEFLLRLYSKNGLPDFAISVIGDQKILIRQRGGYIPLKDYFNTNPPVIWFADGSSLEGNSFTKLNSEYAQFPSQNILTWDWEGTTITKEIQGISKEQDSIQYKVIQKLIEDNCYEVIFNDHGTGECADVVAIKSKDNTICVEFYHCKHSKSSRPGARIDDLYEVCGQAQKNIHWMENPTYLFSHLLAREPIKNRGTEVSRFEFGNKNILLEFKEKISRTHEMKLEIFVVQPGLSKSQVSNIQLGLLSVTENYLMQTYNLFFKVIANS